MRNQLVSPQERHIIPNRLLQVREGQKVQLLRPQLLLCFRSSVTQVNTATIMNRRILTYPRFSATSLYASSFWNVSIPHPVCFTSTISCVPRSCCEMMMLRRASEAEAPA